MIPSLPNPSWFNSLNTAISHFYWKNKLPHIKLKTLQKSKSQGGLEAPNFELYHLSSQLKYLKQWLNPSDLDSHWLETEQALCKDIKLSDLPFVSETIKHNCFLNISIASALTAWWKTLCIQGSMAAPSTRIPIWNNPDFTINRKPLHFTSWKHKGITHLHHILHDSRLIHFQQLIQKFEISSNHYLQYLQLRSTILPKLKNTSNMQDQAIFTEDFMKITGPAKSLSKIYSFLNNSDITIHLPISKWEQDLSIKTDPAFWAQICKNNFTHGHSPNLQLIQFKVNHTKHYTGERLYKMGFITPDQCTHCIQHSTDSYMHALWHYTSDNFVHKSQITYHTL